MIYLYVNFVSNGKYDSFLVICKKHFVRKIFWMGQKGFGSETRNIYKQINFSITIILDLLSKFARPEQKTKRIS